MKRNIIFICTAVVSFCFLLSSCEAPEGNTYQTDGSKVSFQVGRLDLNLTPADGTVIKLALSRSSSVGAFDVPVTLKTNSPALFHLNSEMVSFKEGETVAYAEINHAESGQLNPASTYALVLKLTDMGLRSPSATDSVIINVKRLVTWKTIATGTFTSEFFEDSWPQDLQQSNEDLTLYRLPDCYVTNFPITFTMKEDNSITFSTQQTGYVDAENGMVSFTMPAVASPNQPKKNENVYDLWGRFVVSAGSYGEFHETFSLE